MFEMYRDSELKATEVFTDRKISELLTVAIAYEEAGNRDTLMAYRHADYEADRLDLIRAEIAKRRAAVS